MTFKESKMLSEFPQELDEIISKRFGIKAESTWSLSGKFLTVYEADDVVQPQVEAFIDGFMAGNAELAKRLLSSSGKKQSKK